MKSLQPVVSPSIRSLLSATAPSGRRRWFGWLAFALASLLVHFLFFSSGARWAGFWAPIRPTTIEVRQFDPDALNRIREQWKAKETGKFALSKDVPESAEAPKNARFLSDRNRKVEREQRARNTAVQPVPGDASRLSETGKRKSSPAKSRSGEKPLSDPGVPFDLKSAPKPGDTDDEARDAAGSGADQYIDADLPEGEQNILNTKESVFYSYYARMYEKAGAFWNSLVNSLQLPPNTPVGEYLSVAEVTFNEEGKIIHVDLLERPGLEPLDEVVREVWRRVKEIPNPPRGLLDEKRQVKVRWTFRLDLSQTAGLQFRSPRRTR